MKVVLVTIHGQESKGKNLKELSLRLSKEPFARNWVFINIRYPRLLTVVNALPWVRSMTAKYVAARLDTIDSDYPGYLICVVSHSNGTRATTIAIEKSHNPRIKYLKFRINKLILLGCAVRRNFDWNKYPSIKVVNFISTNDWVIFWARLYGMGTAGRSGFKIKAPNLRQIQVKFGHSGFLEQYEKIRDAIDMAMATP